MAAAFKRDDVTPQDELSELGICFSQIAGRSVSCRWLDGARPDQDSEMEPVYVESQTIAVAAGN